MFVSNRIVGFWNVGWKYVTAGQVAPAGHALAAGVNEIGTKSELWIPGRSFHEKLPYLRQM